MNNAWAVKYQTFQGDRLIVKQKSFGSSWARKAFLDRIEATGELVSLIGFSDPAEGGAN